MNGAPSVALPRAWPLVRSMAGVGALCGLIIVSVFLATGPVIERNRAEALQRAIFLVLPEARTSRTFLLGADGRFVESVEAATGPRVHAGYDADGGLVGLALEAEGMGYQDVIRLLYGYSFEDEAIVGVQVLESRETPGLGDRIESDPEFLANFERLEAGLDEEGAGLAHRIESVKHGTKTEGWQVDGITGATISSNAIAAILDRSAAEWLPRLRERRGDFGGEG